MRVVLYADRASRGHGTGVGAYAVELHRELSLGHDGVDVIWRTADDLAGRIAVARPVALAAMGLIGRPCIARRHTADLVHVLVPGVPSPTGSLPSVMTIHDLTPVTHPQWYASRVRRVFQWHVAWGARHCRLLITDSEAVARDAVRVLGVPARRVRAVHLGTPAVTVPDAGVVDRVLAGRGLDRGGYAVMAGEMTPRKNPVFAVEALGRLVAAGDADSKLVFVGSAGLATDGVRATVGRLGLDDRVELVHGADRAELLALVTGAALCLLPSQYEGFGFPVLEAMACGTPVVASDRGSLPEVVGDGGILVKGGRPDGLADAWRAIRDDADLRRDLVERGRRQASSFTWTRCAAETASVYREALGREQGDSRPAFARP